MKWLATVLCFIASVGLADIIPTDRLVEWSTNTCGIPGGIPVRTNIYNGVAFASTSSLATIQSAINSCSTTGGVVLLSSGTFDWTGQGQLFMKNYVTLRGATNDGPNATKIIGQSASDSGVICFSFSSGPPLLGFKTIDPAANDAVKGGTRLTLLNADNTLRTNYHIYVTQPDPSNTNFICPFGGHLINGHVAFDFTRNGWTHHTSQLVEVTNIDATKKIIDFWPPLCWSFSESGTKEINYVNGVSSANGRGTNFIVWSGIENLAVENTKQSGSSGESIIWFNRVAYCWIKNVKTINCCDSHIRVDSGYRFEIRGNTLTGMFPACNTSSHGYGLLVYYASAGGLIEDNIIADQRDFIKLQGGSVGCAVLYNYQTNALELPSSAGWATHTGLAHSAHPLMNLFEGNVTYTPDFDFYWGSGSHQTLLRNWFRGPNYWARREGAAIKVEKKYTTNNIVGNVLGSLAVKNSAVWSSQSSLVKPNTSWGANGQYATFLIGYYDDTQIDSSYDSNAQWANTIAAGNYDFVTLSTAWYNPSTPDTITNSYFYGDAKPLYFGTNAWPPFSPDPLRYSETAIPAGYRFAYGHNPPIQVLTISPERTKLTNFTTIKIIATAFTNGVTTNLTDLVGFGDYNLTTVNGFFIKTNTGFAIGSSYQWLQGTANVLSSNLPPSLNRQVAANHPLTNSITFSGFTNTALNTSWTWNGSVYSYDVSNFLMSVTTHWQLVSDIFWWTNSNVSPDIGPYVLALGGPTGNSPTVSAFESPTFTAITTTYYLWLDSGSFPGGGTYSDNIIRKYPNAVTWSMDNNTPFASVNDWGQVISGLDPISARLRIWGTWGQFSNYTEVDLTDGRSVSSPAIDTNALKAVMSAKYMSVAH